MKINRLLSFLIFNWFFIIGYTQEADTAYFDIDHALKHIRTLTNNPSEIDSLLRIVRNDFAERNTIKPPVLDTPEQTNRPTERGDFDCESDNWDFNNGTTSGWTTTGNVSMQTGATSDPYGSYPWVYPNGGSHSVKISGDRNAEKNGSISRAITVPSLGTTYFTFHFAMSIFNFPHTASEASKFRVEFFDQNNNLIPCPNFVCYYSSDQGPQGANNFQSTPNPATFYNPNADGDGSNSYGVTYTPWNDVTLDLSGYAGQTITAKFSVEWCIYGPDWSYALLDVDCPTNNNTPFEVCAEELPYTVCSTPGMASYEWRDATGTILGNQECYAVTQAGTYYCDVLPNNVSCSAGSIITYEYVVNKAPKAEFTAPNYCFGSDLAIVNTSVCPNLNTCTYSWDFGNGDVSSDHTPSYTYLTDADQEIKLTVETNNGCTSEMTQNIFVNAPVASFTLANACQDEAVNFTDNSTPFGTSTITGWNWDFGDGNTSTSASPSHTYSSPGLKTVTLEVLSSDGCTSILSQDLSIYAIPQVSFSANDTCFGDATSFVNSTLIATGAIASWTWDLGDGTTETTQTIAHVYPSNGTYQVNLTATSDNNCTASSSKPVIVFSEPVAAYSFLDGCLYDQVNFLDQSTLNTGTITNWSWDFGDGNTSTTRNPNYTYTTDGTFTTTLIVTSDNGCDDTLSQPIIRYPVPQLNFSATPQCFYDPLIFINSSSINAPDNVTSWVWNFGDGSALSSDQTPSHIYAAAGDFNVTLIASSNNGCIASLDQMVKIYPVPVASFTSTTICENEPPTQFTNLSTISSGSIVATNWNFNDGNFSSLPNPTNTFGQHGVYLTQLIVISNFGCRDTIENPVTVLEKPAVDFTSDITEECSPFCINLSDLTTSSNAATVAWEWSFGNNENSFSATPTTCFENLSNEQDFTYFIQLTATNSLGCKNSLKKENYITVFHNPISLFSATPPKTNMYLTTVEFENLSTGADLYNWDLGDNNISELFEVEHNYQDTGKYTVILIAKTLNGCSDTSRLTIAVDPVTSIYVPNTFTPDGDGNNDLFNVVGYNLKEAELFIFDKWGTLIYFTDDLNRGWDGDYKGQPAKTDTYVWKLSVKDGLGKNYDYKGHVFLLR